MIIVMYNFAAKVHRRKLHVQIHPEVIGVSVAQLEKPVLTSVACKLRPQLALLSNQREVTTPAQ